jgi:molecular chaperone GrpE
MTQPHPESDANEPLSEVEKIAELAEAAMGEDDAAIDIAEPEPDYEAQLAEMKDQLIRAIAETDNVRKRAARDLEDTNKYAVSKFAGGLVSVLENLQRATGSISEELRAENAQVKNLAEGVEMTLRELLNVFERFGIKRIDPVGEKFNHQFHQAMQQIEDAQAEAGTVLQVLQAGYVIHDRLLQPALVNVAKKPASDDAKQVDTQA